MAVLLALALVAAACGGDDSADTTTTTSGPAATTTTAADATTTTAAEPMVCEATVGFMGPITGPVAFIGEVQLNWFKYAVDTFNSDMGYDFGIAEFDTQFDAAQASTLAAQVLDNSAIVGIVGPAGSDQVDAAGAVFEAGDPNLTFISPSSTRVGITAKYNGLFRTVGTDDDQGPTTADLIISQGGTKVFMIDDQSSYSTGLADSTQAALEAGNVEVIRESVSQDITDFSALVSNIPDDADFVYLPWQIAANGQILANQMAEQGKDAVIVGSDGMDSDDFSTPGSFILSFVADISAFPQSADLLAGYLAQYPNTNTFGPPVFVATQVILEAIDRVCAAGEVPSRASVLAEVRNTDLADSIIGQPISFTPEGNMVVSQWYVFQIQEDGSKVGFVG